MERVWLKTSPMALESRFQSALDSVGSLNPSSQRIVEIKKDRIHSSEIFGSLAEVEFGKMDLTEFVESRLRVLNRRNGKNDNNGNRQ